MEQYIKDLMEYISIDDKENKGVVQGLVELLGIEKEEALKMIERLDLADYVEATQAINSGNKDRLYRILDIKPLMDDANPFSTNNNATTNAQSMDFKKGDKVNIVGDDGKAKPAEVLDDPNPNELAKIKIDGQEKVVNKAALSKPQGMQEELDRMRKLAGIEVGIEEQLARVKDNRAKAVGKVTTTAPSFLDSAAKAGVVSGPNELPKTKKAKKPGPEVGSKYK